MSGEVVIATLWKHKLSVSAGKGEDWRWTFALTAGPAGFHHQGSAKSQQEAKVFLERSWQNWLRAAGLSASDISMLVVVYIPAGLFGFRCPVGVSRTKAKLRSMWIYKPL